MLAATLAAATLPTRRSTERAASKTHELCHVRPRRDDGIIVGPVPHDAHRFGVVVGDANSGRELYPPN
eukprot:11189797-Lingulodinium_polyedra.AAC.1